MASNISLICINFAFSWNKTWICFYQNSADLCSLFPIFFSLRSSLSIQMPKKNIYKQNFLFGLREFWVWIEIFDQILEFLFMMLHNFSNRSLSWRLKKASLVVRNEKRLKMSDLKVFEKLQRLIETFHDLNAVQWKRFRLRLAAVARCW